jgi:hypothetical protein
VAEPSFVTSEERARTRELAQSGNDAPAIAIAEKRLDKSGLAGLFRTLFS